jgi:osmotically-inducible protein OsmY
MKTNDELQRDVIAELKWDPELKSVATEIGVSVKDGVVTLTGVVDSYRRKIAAEKAAQRVSGVKVVASDIEVKFAFTITHTDTEIAEAVKNALRWNSAVNEDEIEVKVDHGWVYLDGQTEWDFERTAAEKDVENLLGVRGVTNNIALKTKPIDTKDIKSKISAAFHRSATVDSSSITVETSGSSVTLKGKVKSWAERQQAEDVAWSAPGVLNVTNKIDIDVSVFA